jgi:hypothetical protein
MKFYHSTRRHIRENNPLPNQRRQNLDSHKHSNATTIFMIKVMMVIIFHLYTNRRGKFTVQSVIHSVTFVPQAEQPLWTEVVLSLWELKAVGGFPHFIYQVCALPPAPSYHSLPPSAFRTQWTIAIFREYPVELFYECEEWMWGL